MPSRGIALFCVAAHLDEPQNSVVYPHPHGQEKRASWTQIAKHPQLLVLADPPVISLGRLLEVLLVLRHLLRIGERHAVDPLECVVFRVAEEVGG